MKIIRPYARMLTTGGVTTFELVKIIPLYMEPLNFVNWAARISHRAENAEKQDVERFLRSVVLQHGDWSVTEHINVSVDAVVDRGITHEIVRHRLGAYTQESTRFVNYAKKMAPSFIYPIVGVECEHCLAGNEPRPVAGTEGEGTLYQDEYRHLLKDGSCLSEMPICAYDLDWLSSIAQCESSYKNLLTKGWRPQEARSVFPNALAARIVITYNLRMWRHFFLMRTSKEAHPQMRQVTIPLLAEFQKAIPVLYEDIIPEARQIDNMSKAR